MKRELLVSFVGHALLIAVLAVLGAERVAKDTRRPMVLSVSVVSAGSPLPQQETKGTTLVESKPAVQAKSQAKSTPKPDTGSTYKRQGLGAKIEGAEALGYSYYLNVILTRISENWLDPYQGQNTKLTATVVFVIERDGSVKEVKLEKTSGDRAYDNSATRALLVLDRLPPLPPEFTGPRLKLHLEFEHTP
jgi:TonB family protein